MFKEIITKDDRYYLGILLSKNMELHNRLSSAIEEIALHKCDSREVTKVIIDSIKYVAEDMERIINR